jgi:Uma2 family endonuclease
MRPGYGWNVGTRFPPTQQAKDAEICPDFVIEVRSDQDRLPAVQARMAVWLANGAELGWLIDPQRKVVEIYRSGQASEVHENPTGVQGTGCVSGFCLVMERVWG